MGDWIVTFEIEFDTADDARRALALRLGEFGAYSRSLLLTRTEQPRSIGAFWSSKSKPSDGEMAALARWAVESIRRTGLSAQRVTSVAYRPESDVPAGILLGIDPGDATSEEIADFLRALSALHRAAGGNGLSFEVDGEHVVARAEELV